MDDNQHYDPYPELTNANKLIVRVVQLGEEWADADAAATTLEETKRTLLAQLTMEHMKSAPSTPAEDEDDESAAATPKRKARGVSKTEAELRATADPRFQEHLRNMVEARRKANRTRVRYDLGKMHIELQRSIHATRRQEMRLSSTGA